MALVIEGTMGPLTQKRRRLRTLCETGVNMILTASTTATVATQSAWLQRKVPLIGYDPLLAIARGKTETVVVNDQTQIKALRQY